VYARYCIILQENGIWVQFEFSKLLCYNLRMLKESLMSTSNELQLCVRLLTEKVQKELGEKLCYSKFNVMILSFVYCKGCGVQSYYLSTMGCGSGGLDVLAPAISCYDKR